MDLKFKGRTWVGNIYHKFEAICHEVDEFVNKDTAKYLENQVHTVNASVKDFYSNVLHDFQPPLGDRGQLPAQIVTKVPDDTTGTSIRSVVGVKEKPAQSTEMKLSEKLDTVNPINSSSSDVDSLKKFSLSPYVDFPKEKGSGLHWQKDNNASFSKTMIDAEKDDVVEDYWEDSHLSNGEDINSSKLLLHSREQYLLTKNVESPDNGNFSLPSNMSNSQDKSNIILADSSTNVIEAVGPSTAGEEDTKCDNKGFSEKIEFGFSSEQEDDTAIWKNSKMGVENESCTEDKNSCQFLCVKEGIPVTNKLYAPEDNIFSLSPSADVDNKHSTLVKHLLEIVVPDERKSCVSMTETMDNCADLSEEVKNKSSLQQDGVDLEVSLTKENPPVNSRNACNYRSSSKLSLLLSKRDSLTEEPSSVKDGSLPEIPLMCNEKSTETTMEYFSPETSVVEWLRILEDEGGFGGRNSPEEVETDLSFGSCRSCRLPELGLEENDLMLEHSQISEDSCDLSVHSRHLHLGIQGLNSTKDESSSESFLISETEDPFTAVAAKMLPTTTVHNKGLRVLHEDEATYTICSDVISTENAPSDLVSSNISLVHHVVQSEASSSSMSTELSHANHSEKNEKMCGDCIHPSCSADLSTTSYVSLCGLGSNGKTGNQMLAFSRTSSSPEIVDDLAVDIVDADLETIDLSDKAKLEEKSSIVDDELVYTPSFRPRKFRSYKELIQQAFSSRKRLVKEYKQLPIWYADFDKETGLLSEKDLLPQKALSQAPTPGQVPASTPPFSHASNTGDSDWEIL